VSVKNGSGTNPEDNANGRWSPMLLEYIQAALCHARYEILPDDRSYYGAINECTGVYANAETLEGCREQLRQVLEEWVLFRVHRNLPLPVIDGIELAIKEVA
jgi:predicted RNase H-like HicB family nuclease